MSSSETPSPRVSVIVVTRDNADLLRDALASILADPSAVPRELVVVDNGSRDATAEVVAEAAGDAPFAVRLLAEPEPGLSRGRNRGVAAARGELLLFTDDDVVVEDGWADRLAAAFDDPRVGFAGGRTLPLWPEPPPRWMEGPHWVHLALYDHGDESRPLAPGEHVAGANMAIRASLLGPAPFPVDLGNAGDRRFGYEETHVLDAIRREHAAAYVADAVVHHRIRRERMQPSWFRATYFDQGIALVRIEERERGVARPALPRRVLRAVRTCGQALRLRFRNDRRGRGPDEMWDELERYKWAGRHVDLLLRNHPGLSRRVRDLVA
ncbi:MAG TPA: glycosyltransferase family 2 protein [Gaiellaceae bacterium]|nr:glycosyltransferase family 2 protein [Gaiellaceae bacterium]